MRPTRDCNVRTHNDRVRSACVSPISNQVLRYRLDYLLKTETEILYLAKITNMGKNTMIYTMAEPFEN